MLYSSYRHSALFLFLLFSSSCNHILSIHAFDNELENKEVLHFHIHIPKTGGTFLRDQINVLLMESDKWNALEDDDKDGVCGIGFTKMTSREFPEVGFLPGFRDIGEKKCSMYSSEAPYPRTNEASTQFDYVYTTIRDPKTHVISQFSSR